ncbi:unnamed protein product, partial [Pleuronectes platessa]
MLAEVGSRPPGAPCTPPARLAHTVGEVERMLDEELWKMQIKFSPRVPPELLPVPPQFGNRWSERQLA